MIHGGPGLDHHFMLPLAMELRDDFELLLPDLPGHGGSQTTPYRAPGLHQLVTQLDSWLEHVPGGFDFVVAHSFGAWLVRHLLRQRKIDPRAVVLITPPAASAPQGTAVRFIASLDHAGTRDDVRSHLENECGAPLGAEEELLLDHALLRSPGAYRALLRNLHRHLAGPVRHFDPRRPVLVIAGSEDRTTPAPQATIVANSMKGARLEVVEGAGHYVLIDRAAECAELIRRFLAEV